MAVWHGVHRQISRRNTSEPTVRPGSRRYCQQYLYKVPNGYDCHAETGVKYPGR
ncbi:MAG TPA: hypothetical protein VHV82_00505 [Sporichthyaceae bacterium]|nr:hypothetical protein [Sporichthyaceae bacterium]